jgi:uncharacterized protein (DUF488 family)
MGAPRQGERWRGGPFRDNGRAVIGEGPSRPRAAPGWGKARILAIGHSTRPIEELVELLREAAVSIVADVRTVPRSRRNPQFESRALAVALRAAGIAYEHLPKLGGLRRPRKDSRENAAWLNASFRGYADHMQTPEFEEGLCQLRALAKEGPVALLCAEAVPWRCHRSLISDALLAHGVVVQHILGRGTPRPHRLTSFARVEGRRVTYPPVEPPAVGVSAP